MKTFLTILMLSVFTIGFTQPNRDKMRQRIKAEKIAFITEKLDLTEAEAVKFWPIYNKHETTRRDIKKKYLIPIKKKTHRNENISETEADNLLKDLITAENKMHEAKITLVKDLKGSIPAIKIIKLKAVEDAFNKKLLERLKRFRNKRDKE